MKTREDLVKDITRTLVLVAVADGVDAGVLERAPLHPGQGGEWDYSVPEIEDPAAISEAQRIAERFERHTSMTLEAAYKFWSMHSDRPHRFGSCLALQALGHGVSLNDEIVNTQPDTSRLVKMLKASHKVHSSFYYFDLTPELWPFVKED